jgi:hypothetical protein
MIGGKSPLTSHIQSAIDTLILTVLLRVLLNIFAIMSHQHLLAQA